MQHPLPDPFESQEAERLVEPYGLGLRVGHDPDASQSVTLLDGNPEDVT